MNAAIERASRDEIETLQQERLAATLERVRRTPLGEREFTTKDDLREHYPLGLLAVDRSELRRIHASSGSRGRPTVVAYTQGDLDVWSEVMARCMAMAGVQAGMVVHNAYGYGLFTGGLGFHQGAERLGALTIPVSGGVTGRQALLLRDLQGQALCCTPSYALHIAQALGEAGIGADELALEIGMFGAEPWTEAMRDQLEAELGLVALNVYGLSEIVGPGVSAECPEARDGLHVQEDHFMVEVIDPETGKAVPDGTDGELVFTTLTKEAMPLLRYRTGDIASLAREPCACGRTFARMSAVRGRRDDMLIVRGMNLYPSQIEHVLLQVDGIAPHYQLVVERPEHLDEITVHCEPTGPAEGLADRVEHAIHREIGIHVEVEVLKPGAVPRSEGKAVRVIDKR
ncbi:MAG TPA: phenylacetate--CoA ligase [Solirubrobacter sp.]|nr:phenylacetate--CoA ligase [Solirubrobacter sp.]